MAKFDRFTKELALGNFRQAYRVLIGDDIDTEGNAACIDHPCHNGNCPARCFCFFGFCFG